MTDEEAIAILNLDKAGHQISEQDNSTKPYWDNVIEALGKAVESLKEKSEAEKKQIPMKPEKVTDDGEIYKCPVCSESLFSSCEFQFCNVCGQALDWSDD